MVHPGKIAASYDKGVLEIDLPKATGGKAKKIEVRARKKQAQAARPRRAKSAEKQA